MIAARLLPLFAAFWLGACTLIPEYIRPSPPVPDRWPAGPAYSIPPAPEEAPLAPDLGWRQYFTDPRLQALIETGLRNNRDLRAAALNVERARALYRIREVEILPTADASGRMLRERIPGSINGNGESYTVKQYRAQVGVTAWEIDFFGRIRSLTQAALEQYFASEQARRSAQILLIAEIATAYLNVAADRDSLELSRSTLDTQLDAYHLIRRRFEVGIVPELDVRQSQTRVDSARVDVVRFTEQVARDENALTLLIGSPVAPDLLPEGLGAVAEPQPLLPGLPSDVLLRRPDVLQAENLLRAANANIGAARAAFFPSITLTGAVGTASGDLSNLFGPGSFAWNFIPQVTMPIFDARTWAALEVTEAEQALAVNAYEGAIQAAFRDVADALARYGTIGEQVQAQESLVNATRESYRLSTARYEKGIDIFLNVLDAQRSLYAAQQVLILTRLVQLSNRVQLYAALGGGGGDAEGRPATVDARD
jgi:multidrug efflux system outer membrane protein